MASWTRVNAPDVEPLPVFAHAAIAGDQIYVSGMLGVTDDASGVVEGGVGAETKQAFRHVEKILAACDATLADIVKVSVFLPDLAEWQDMNTAYLEVFGEQTPARIAIGCADLLFGAKVEFDCVAYKPR